MNLYDLPKYYDLSYSWNMRDEISFLKQVFHKYTNSVRPSLLEPACGTGRLLLPLARAGFDCTGFDRNTIVLDYLKKNCIETGYVPEFYRLRWLNLPYQVVDITVLIAWLIPFAIYLQTRMQSITCIILPGT